MRKSHALLLAPSCALLLALGACGSDESEARDSIRSSLLGDPDFAGTELTDEEAGCVADGAVEEVGVESLRDYGLIDDDNEVIEGAKPQDLTADDAEALATTLVDCVDAAELLREQLGGFTQELPDRQAACVADVFDDELTTELLAARFRGEELTSGLPGDVEERLTACLGEAAKR